MAAYADNSGAPLGDRVSNVLKWILLAVAVGSFALFAWATVLTYDRAAPQPDRFVAAGGATLMTAEDIVAGKAGFQKADLMDYGSLYGMGSYFGQDYTAFALVRHVIPAKALLSALILCALVTPPIVTALSTYLFFVQIGLVNTVVGRVTRRSESRSPRRDAAATANGQPDGARGPRSRSIGERDRHAADRDGEEPAHRRSRHRLDPGL